MPPKRCQERDFNQQRVRESWTRIDELRNDFQAFATFVYDPSNAAHKRFGSYAMAQVKSFLPEVEREVGPASTHKGPFKIYLDQGPTRNFVSVSKATGDGLLVWSCWQNEQVEQTHRAALDGAGCLKTLGSVALGAAGGIRVRLIEQEDRSLTWKATSIHPLQVRENAYQRIVHKAGVSGDTAREQLKKLSEFFVQSSGQPSYLRKREPLKTSGGRPLAAVVMNHLLDPYYLFRLLVLYRIESTSPIGEEQRIQASADLTRLLHNGDRAKMGWLSAWLTRKIAELNTDITGRLNAGGRTRVIFFLKGGRALNFFLGTPEKGENDWDTQVVIDPRLPAEEWYQCLAEVHDVVLAALARFSQEFTALVEANAGSFAAYLEDAAAPEVGDDEEVDEHEASDTRSRSVVECRAELIDVGIPRRDSAAALEEWTRLSAPHALERSDGVVFPHRGYYLNEYLLMIRDAFLGVDVQKAPKRLTRFGVILESGADESPSVVDTTRLAALPAAASAAAALDSHARRALYRVVLTQFVEACNLLQDRALAAHVDEECAALISAPPPMPPALAERLDNAQKVLAADVGVAHAISTRMDEHWARRHDFFERERDFFARLMLDLFRLTREPLMNVHAQFAIAGSYAARLHARHLRVSPEGLEPIRRILCKLQCPQGSDREAVMRAVAQTIATAARNTNTLTVAEGGRQSLLLYWSEPIPIGAWSYAPLVVKVRVAEQTGTQLPVLSSIDGLPVLDLRYLAADYVKKTAKIDERGARRVLASATAAVSEMLSRFDFDSDDEGDDKTVTLLGTLTGGSDMAADLARVVVKIDNQEYNALTVPDETAKLVNYKKALVLDDMKLDDLLRNLATVGQLLFVAYNGVAGTGKVVGKVSKLHTDYNHLCGMSKQAMQAFEVCCTKVLQHMTTFFGYLMQTDEETALLYLVFMAETATEMSKVADSLAKEFAGITADAQIALADTENAKADEEKAQQTLLENRTKLEADTVEQKELLKGIEALKVRLQKLYDDAKEQAEKHEGRAFGLAIAGAIMGPIGQGLGTFGAMYMAGKQIPPVLQPTAPTAPVSPPKEAAPIRPTATADSEAEDSVEVKEAKAEVKAAKLTAAAADTEVTTAKGAVEKAKGDAETAKKAFERAERNATEETDAEDATKLRGIATKKRAEADKADAAVAAAEQKKSIAATGKQTADQAVVAAEAKVTRLVAALASGVGEALKSAATTANDLGKSYADIAAEYNKERREYLNQLLKQEENERAALAKVEKFGILMQGLNASAGMAELVVAALHQAVGALKQIVTILETASRVWSKMADRCRELTSESSVMKREIEMWSKRAKEDRVKLYTGEPFLLQVVNYYAGWKALQVISRDYAIEAGKIQVAVQAQVKLNLHTNEMLQLAVAEGKKLQSTARKDIEVIDTGADEIKIALTIKDPTPSAAAAPA